MKINISDYGHIVDLVNNKELNGELCEVLTEPAENTVPEFDGIQRTAVRVGIRILRTGQTGYLKPENFRPWGGAD